MSPSRPSVTATACRPFSSASSILPAAEAALSTVAVVELVHGVHRANTDERRARREAFVEDLLAAVTVYPLTTDIARLAGKLDAEQQRDGVVIPFADLLIGTTALSLGYSVLTTNLRHFGRIPGLSLLQL